VLCAELVESVLNAAHDAELSAAKAAVDDEAIAKQARMPVNLPNGLRIRQSPSLISAVDTKATHTCLGCPSFRLSVRPLQAVAFKKVPRRKPPLKIPGPHS
jgi:hypothetical protein